MKYLTATVLILSCIFLSGYDQSKRKLVGGCVLERFDENGEYYVESPDEESRGGGEAANKIGTYPKAVLAARHKIPFYVAIPLSTIDWNLKSG